MSKLRRVFIAVGLVVASAAHAGSFICGPTVYDAANVGANAAAALEAVHGVQQRVDAYRRQRQQLVLAGRQAAGLVSSAQQLATNERELADLRSYAAALGTLYGSTTDMQRAVQRRLQMARASATSWEAYAATERHRIQSNEQGAVDTAAEEQRLLERVQRDYGYARQMEAQIKASSGIHADAQNMNRVLNRMITQQAEFARVVTPLGLGQGAAVQAALSRAAKRQQSLEHTKELDAIAAAVKQSEARAAQSLEGVK